MITHFPKSASTGSIGSRVKKAHSMISHLLQIEPKATQRMGLENTDYTTPQPSLQKEFIILRNHGNTHVMSVVVCDSGSTSATGG